MKKLITTILVIAVLFGLYGFDYYRAQDFTISVTEISPEPAPADGQTPVLMTVKLTDKSGKPVKGHDLYAFSANGGNFRTNRITTDANGECIFTYFSYKLSSVQPLRDAQIKIRDESNSIFIEVNAQTEVAVKLEKPEEEAKSEFNLDDIFG